MSRILIVEDDETILFALRSALGRNGYEVSAAGSLEEAKRFIQNPADLILLDLGLPDGEGLTLLKDFREAGGPPVIILTARDDEADIIKGLDAGADDYVTKPFKLGILLSRIRAALRRAVEKEKELGWEETQLLTCGDVVLDKKRTLVSVGGKETVLTAGEYRLLEILLENKNRTLTRTLLLERLWDIDGDFVNSNTLTVLIKRLREKLGGDPQRIIRTVRGIGYKAEDRFESPFQTTDWRSTAGKPAISRRDENE